MSSLRLKHNEIAWIVVLSISIFMMYDFTREQRSIQHSFGYNTMLKL
jgi:hypothetical protein